jgi:hypothetical protein
MSPKNKSKSSPKTSTPLSKMEREAFALAALASLTASTPTAADRRKELLARVAGSVASGLVISPSPSIASPSGMATAAVDIAEEILKKAGISPGTTPTETDEDAS